MNKLPSETYDYVKEVVEATKGASCEVVCCTPYVCLAPAVEAAKGTHVKIGAENLHFEDKGAFTGEVSADMLVDMGVQYVIMGHSERREYNNETDETVNLKAKKALEKGLIPIVCCGESLEQREAGITMDKCRRCKESCCRIRANLGNRNGKDSHRRPGRRSLRRYQKDSC